MRVRAFSTFEVKAVDEEKRIIEGVASTPTTDRMGDVVEPKGAQFALPLPFLRQHRAAEPIGHVTKAKVTKDGISVQVKLFQIDEPPSLKDRLDTAWAEIKSGLVRGLSIGFKSLEQSFLEESSGIHFLKWEWLELSAVTVPANAEASIQTIKSIDEPFLRAASGDYARRSVASLSLVPGASGSIAANSKGRSMKTLKEQIEAFEAKRLASSARMNQIMETAAAGDVTLDETQKQEYDALETEIKEIDEHLVRLRKFEATNREKAKPVEQQQEPRQAISNVPSTVLSVKQNLEPGQKFARYVMALYQGGNSNEKALAIVQNNKRWMDTSPELATVFKAAVAAGDTTTTGWAAELVYAQNLQSEFIEYLRPQTILGRISGFRTVPFNVRVPSQTATGTGYWVGQGMPIPLSKPTLASVTLGITKCAGMMAIDDELARSSSPSAELLVRDDLAKTIAVLLDVSFIDPNQGGVTNVQPPSVTYGVTPISPSGTNYAAFVTDIKSMFSSMITANQGIGNGVFIMSESTALALSLMVTSLGVQQFNTMNPNGGTLLGHPVVVSQSAFISGSPDYGNMIVYVVPSEILLADEGGVTISISNEASIQMLDNPTNQSTGATAPTTVVSMFQTHSLAIKAVRYISWLKARSTAVAFIRGANYA